jgi:hypothetical protein
MEFYALQDSFSALSVFFTLEGFMKLLHYVGFPKLRNADDTCPR